MLSIRQIISRRLMSARILCRYGDGCAARFMEIWFRRDFGYYGIQIGD